MIKLVLYQYIELSVMRYVVMIDWVLVFSTGDNFFFISCGESLSAWIEQQNLFSYDD